MEFSSFDIAAVFICITCLVYMALHRRYDKLQSKIFIITVIDVGITAASNAAAELIRIYAITSPFAETGVNIAGFVYFVTHTALGPLFFLYVLAVCRTSFGKNPVRNNLIALPFYLTELLVITNPLTGWVYVYGPHLELVRGWGMSIVYVVNTMYFVLGFVQLIRRWRALTPVKRRGLGYFCFVAAIGIVVQLVMPTWRVELFAESLALLGVLMFVENEEDQIDSEAGVYNRYALEMDLGMYASLNRPYYIIAVRVTNADAFAHIGGTASAAQFMSTELANFFKEIVPWYHVYRTGPARFVIVDPQMSAEKASDIAHEIADRFKCSWRYRDVDIDLHAVVALACVPTDLPTADDVFYLVDTPVPVVVGKEVLEGDDLSYVIRRAEVERAVQRGFDEGTYEVYYQPIFRADGSVCSAEALMRLHDRVLGDIPPFEFIEVAERMGVVENIGEFALKEVCAFAESGVPKRLGIEHISVNLSVIQCMQADFTRRVNDNIASFDIDSTTVSFEITESMAAGNYELLNRVMSQLKESGHRFAMDDYGTGYSNMHSLVALDFDVVKIDKSVLWDAEKSSVGMVILQNSVLMMRDVGSEVLVEGVETAQQVELLRRLGVDYFQGFYFAKPMPRDEFIAFVEKHRV